MEIGGVGSRHFRCFRDFCQSILQPFSCLSNSAKMCHFRDFRHFHNQPLSCHPLSSRSALHGLRAFEKMRFFASKCWAKRSNAILRVIFRFFSDDSRFFSVDSAFCTQPHGRAIVQSQLQSHARTRNRAIAIAIARSHAHSLDRTHGHRCAHFHGTAPWQ